MNRNEASLPRRFFGPVTLPEARALVDRMTGSDDRTTIYYRRLEAILVAFAAGRIDPRDMSYQIQTLFEECEESLAEQEAPEVDAMDAFKMRSGA